LAAAGAVGGRGSGAAAADSAHAARAADARVARASCASGHDLLAGAQRDWRWLKISCPRGQDALALLHDHRRLGADAPTFTAYSSTSACSRFRARSSWRRGHRLISWYAGLLDGSGSGGAHAGPVDAGRAGVGSGALRVGRAARLTGVDDFLASSFYVDVGGEALAGGGCSVSVAISTDHAVRVERAGDAYTSLLAAAELNLDRLRRGRVGSGADINGHHGNALVRQSGLNHGSGRCRGLQNRGSLDDLRLHGLNRHGLNRHGL
ncbi:hypothetical protein PMAYCL1PPCAC_04438, partial [Pristionchus mayeri]